MTAGPGLPRKPRRTRARGAAVDALVLLDLAFDDFLEGRVDRWPELLERAREIERRPDLPPEDAAIARLVVGVIAAGPDGPSGLHGLLDRLGVTDLIDVSPEGAGSAPRAKPQPR